MRALKEALINKGTIRNASTRSGIIVILTLNSDKARVCKNACDLQALSEDRYMFYIYKDNTLVNYIIKNMKPDDVWIYDLTNVYDHMNVVQRFITDHDVFTIDEEWKSFKIRPQDIDEALINRHTVKNAASGDELYIIHVKNLPAVKHFAHKHKDSVTTSGVYIIVADRSEVKDFITDILKDVTPDFVNVYKVITHNDKKKLLKDLSSCSNLRDIERFIDDKVYSVDEIDV